MSLCKIGPMHAEVLSTLHATSFERPWKISEFAELLRLPTTHGWANENGFILCSHVADEMEILTICVVPAKRRQGIAKTLLDEAINFAHIHKVSTLFLEVRADNESAQNLYIGAGFTHIGHRPNYYKTSDGFCDALCLQKKL